MNDMINNYFKFVKEPAKKTRYNLHSYSEPAYYSKTFNPLIKPFIYLVKNPNIKASGERKTDMQISWESSKNLTSLYPANPKKPAYYFGDIYKTDDMILFVKENDYLEFFILRDKINLLESILSLWNDDYLEHEIEFYRDKSILFKLG